MASVDTSVTSICLQLVANWSVFQIVMLFPILRHLILVNFYGFYKVWTMTKFFFFKATFLKLLHRLYQFELPGFRNFFYKYKWIPAMGNVKWPGWWFPRTSASFVFSSAPPQIKFEKNSAPASFMLRESSDADVLNYFLWLWASRENFEQNFFYLPQKIIPTMALLSVWYYGTWGE